MTMIYGDLNHLSPEKIEDFYVAYLNQKAGEVVKEHHLHPSVTNHLHKLLPTQLATANCELCFGTLYSQRLRKSEVQSGINVRTAKCEECSHEQTLTSDLSEVISSVFDCNCPSCKKSKTDFKNEEKAKQVEKEKEIQAANGKKIVEAFTVERHYIPFIDSPDTYDLSDVVTLMAIMFARWTNKEGDKEDDDYIAPLDKGELLVYATDEVLNNHPIKSCIRNELISFDLNRCYFNYFVIEDDKPISYFPFKIPFQSNFTDEEGENLTNKETYERLCRKFSDGYWYSDWNDQLLNVWVNLGVAECIEYAKSKAEYYNFGFNSETKISEIVRDLLNVHSVSECFFYISVAYMNAAAFYQSSKAQSKKHAENTVPSKILSLAKAGSAKPWDRPSNMPRSAFSIMLFDVMLNSTGDAGFYLVPGRNYQDLLSKTKFLWPEVEEELPKINITGEVGLFEYLSVVADSEVELSTDSVNKQIVHLSIIADYLGLREASKVLQNTLMSDTDIEYSKELMR